MAQQAPDDFNLTLGQWIFILIVAIFGVILCVISTVFAIELLTINPPADIYAIVEKHRLSLQSSGTLLESLFARLPMYKDIASAVWLVWLVPLVGVSLVGNLLFFLRYNSFYTNFKNKLNFYRGSYLREQKKKKEFQDKAEEMREHFFSVQDNLDDGFIVLTMGDSVEHANREARVLFEKWAARGNRSVQIIGFKVQDLFPGYLTSGIHLLIQEAVTSKHYAEREIYLDPVQTWLMVRVSPTPYGTYIYFRDITDSKKSDNFFKTSERILLELVNNAPMPVAVVNRQWEYLVASQTWSEMFRIENRLNGKSHLQILPKFPGNFKEMEKDLLQGIVVSRKEETFSFAGNDEVINWEIRPWADEHDRIAGYVMYAQFVTEHVRNQKKSDNEREREKQLAYHDILTGLPNRQLFYDRLNMALATAYRQVSKVALMFLDLDGFKAVNDTLGHDTGDMLLKEVAKRLKTVVRDTDTVARLGGDEFTVILTGISDRKDVEKIAQKIIETIRLPYELGAEVVNVSTSVGVSMYPQDGSSNTELIKKSDTAMYHAKQSGKNQAIFYADMSQTSSSGEKIKENELEAALRTAIQKGELEVFYQPQYNLKFRTIFGLEALLRWNHSELGLLSPAQFLDMAERTGMILPIGEWVMRTSFARASEWNAKSHDKIRINVNLSTKQLLDKSLYQRIERNLREAKLSPKHLGLEISETALQNQRAEVVETLQRLRSEGINIVIDDFGTSATPIGNLRNFPVDGLKIHQSFVHRALRNKKDAAIVKAVIKMAADFGLTITAAGVETQEQADFLLANGCSNAQGFLFGQPVQPVEVPQFFKPKKSS